MQNFVMTLWRPEASGQPKMCLSYCQALLDRGAFVTLAHGPTLNTSGEELLSQFRDLGVKTCLVPELDSRRLLTGARKVAKLAANARAASVIGFQQKDRPFAVLAARLAGIRSIVHIGGHLSFAGSSLSRWVKKVCYGFPLRMCDAVITVNPKIQDILLRDVGLRKEKLHMILNGVEYSAIRDHVDELRKDGVRNSRFQFACVGRLTPVKGHDILLKALSEIASDVEVIVAGNELPNQESRDYASKLQETAKGLRDNVRVSFPGEFSRDRVLQLFATSDAYIHPSRSEGWSLAVSEAMSAGLPCLLTDCAGVPEGFQIGRDGLIVPAADHLALRDGIRKMIGLSNDERKSMGESAGAYAERYLDVVRANAEFCEVVGCDS